MTHEKFIEQLNLYLDGELPPGESVELERAIAENIEYRRVYRQYCQMQQACAGLAERFREEAAPAPQFRRGRVVELDRRASGDWLRSIALIASGAMAACVVFVAIGQFSSPATAPALAENAPTAGQDQGMVPYTTTVAANANPAGFRNPWSSNQPVVDFTRPAANAQDFVVSTPDSTTLANPELKVELQPYGKAPGSMLQMEEIQAAAFQFQRQ